MFSLDNLRGADLQLKLQYAFTFGLINEAPTQDFIDTIRRREGIEPPANKKDLRYNLAHYKPKDYEPEALAFAQQDAIPNPTPADLGLADLSAMNVAEVLQQQPLIIFPTDFFQSVINPIVFPKDLAERIARVIARHIVTGYMEIPKPIAIRVGHVATDDSSEIPTVVAVAVPGTDLNQLVRQFRAACKEAFQHGPRYRGPDDIVETGWLRAYSKHLKRLSEKKSEEERIAKDKRERRGVKKPPHSKEAQKDDDPTQEEDLRRDLATVEFSFELWPDLRPTSPEGSPAYERELKKRAKNFRANSSNFEAWIDRMMPAEQGPQT